MHKTCLYPFFFLFIFSSARAQIITTIAGNGATALSGDGGPATAAGCTAFDVRMDGAGNILISDRLNARIRIVNSSGIISTWAGTATGYYGDGGPASNAKLNILNGVTFDLSGNFYIADGPNNRVRMVNPSGIISTFAGIGTWGSSGDGGPATLAQIADGYGVAVDNTGNIIYISDSYFNRIRMVNRSTGIITTIAGTGSVGFSGDGGPATNAQFSWPTGMTCDHAGNLYIADFENNRIRRVDATTGIITTVAGSGAVGTVPGAFTGSYTGDGGPATAATLNGPAYLTIDGCGNIYFTDNGNNCVRKINASGIITTIAGTGAPGFGGDGGPATAALLSEPTGITIDNAGNLLVADAVNNRLRKITLALINTASGRDTTVCPGTTVTLYADTAGSYLWSNGDTTASVTATDSGIYWVTTTFGGCSSVTDTTHILYSAGISVNLGNDTAFCAGDSIVLAPVVPAGCTLLWSTGSTGPSITVDSTGTYWVVVNNELCTGSDTISIVVNPSPAVNLGHDTALCIGTPLTLQSADSYSSPSYLWSTGSTTPSISPTTSGIYWLKVTAGGCSGTDTVDVTFQPVPKVILGGDIVLCPHSERALGSPEPPGAQYMWSTGSTDSSITVSDTGIYSLTVDLNGCKATASVAVIPAGPVSSVSLGPDTTLCLGATMVLSVSSDSALWSTDTKGPSITVNSSGTYWVTVPEECGSASDTIAIDFLICDIVFPSAFTPNGDGLNDIIKAYGSLQYCTSYSLSIYNRWGERIFYTEDIYDGWDGKFHGVKQDMGTYFYLIHYSIQGAQHKLKGAFELIR